MTTSIKVEVEKVENGYIVTGPVFVKTIAGHESEVKQTVFVDMEDMLTHLRRTFDGRLHSYDDSYVKITRE